ncbi:hypothetical protein E2542_SST08354 [Spatholobus suberectus]|nr:hypothetical protein E2542_SST08354 [Spatholobus suberectus]
MGKAVTALHKGLDIRVSSSLVKGILLISTQDFEFWAVQDWKNRKEPKGCVRFNWVGFGFGNSAGSAGF